MDALSAGEKDAAMEIAKSLEADFASNIAEIQKLETQKTEAIESRDKAKSKLRDVAGKFGVDAGELTADKIDELIGGKKDTSGIEAKYKAEFEAMATKLEQTESSYKSKLQSAIIDKELLQFGTQSNVAQGKALNMLTNLLKDGASIEDGGIVYRDGEALIRNDKGRPMSIKDKFESIKSSGEYDFLFAPSVKEGGGKPPNVGGNNGGARTIPRAQFDSMSHAERAAFVKDGGRPV